jgi:hypothetical protein
MRRLFNQTSVLHALFIVSSCAITGQSFAAGPHPPSDANKVSCFLREAEASLRQASSIEYSELASISSSDREELKRVRLKAKGVLDNPNTIGTVDRVLDHSKVFVARKNGAVVGFTALESSSSHPFLQSTPYETAEVKYLSMGMVLPELEGKGIYKRLSELRLAEVLSSVGDPLMMVRTQNPKVYSGTIWSLEAAKTSGKIRKYTLVLKKIQRGVYGNRLTKEVQSVNDPATMAMFESLNTAAGDAFVLVWKIEK